MKNNVCYQFLRPAEIVRRRKECPVVYIPIGTLEWHGVHNPVGADAIQAEHLAILCAQKGGGLVFPALYYGESRTEGLMESNASDAREIAEKMELDPGNFSPERFTYTEEQQTESYQRLLIHILNQAETLGFEVAVFIAGHYPLVDHARAAAILYNRRVRNIGRMLAWAAADHLFLRPVYANAGDHGGGWETSHIMAIDPELADLSLLGPKGEKPVGVGGGMAPQDATAQFGKQIFNDAAEIIIKETLHRLNNKGMYKSNGATLLEGLWK